MTTRRRLLGAAVGVGLAAAVPAAAAPRSPTARAGATALRRGVNLSAWLNFDRRHDHGPKDFATIKRAGFDHVRLCVDFALLGWRSSDPGDLPGVAVLDRAIGMATDAGLVAILDCHADAELLAAVEDDLRVQAALVRLWRRLARRYAAVSRNGLAFELLNEPQYYRRSPARWLALQDRLLRAVRDFAPEHTVLVTGRKGSRIDTLAEMSGRETLRDPNIAAVFHFYRPYIVTHQGATWGYQNTAIPFVRGVAYPTSRLNDDAVTIAPGIDRARARREIDEYAAEGWNKARVEGAIVPAAVWGGRSDVPVICNEFGVYRRYAAPATRWRWLGDVRRAAERHGIGWTVWDYADTFAVSSLDGAAYTTKDGAVMPKGPGGRRYFSAAARDALGLPA